MNVRGKCLLAAVLCLAILAAGCSTAWIGQAEELVAALIPAASNLIALVATLQGKSVSAQDLQTIQNAGTQAGADLQLIQSLITQYQNADATAKPGILAKIQTALTTVQANLSGLMGSVHISDPATQAKVTAVVGILVSEVQSLAAIVPIVSGDMASGKGSTLASKNAARGSRPVAPLSASEFVKSYNATMTAKTGNAELDRATAGLRIHVHAKLERWASAGWLK